MSLNNETLQVMIQNVEEKLDDHIQSSKEFQSEILDSLKENTKISQSTYEQSLKTNGRVNGLDEWKKTQAQPVIDEFTKYKHRLLGAVAVISIIWAFVQGLYVDKLKRDITTEVSDDIIKTLESKYYVEIHETK